MSRDIIPDSGKDKKARPIRSLPLDKLTHDHASLEPVPSIGCNVYHVKKPFALIQAAGYLKHVRAIQANKAVYFRGQAKLYATLPPTLYRGIQKHKARDQRDAKMQIFLKKMRKDKHVLRAVPDYAPEPLLHHYGLRTRWLDAVDNVWVALWFACHTAYGVGRHGQYLHFEKRIPRHTPHSENFAYIVLLEVAATPDEDAGPGCFKDAHSAAIDLRTAAPSHFVRPHAQYGLVVKALDAEHRTDLEFSKLLAGIIRVELADALDWLGEGDMLNVHALFPPPPYDFGYQEILANIATADEIGRAHV